MGRALQQRGIEFLYYTGEMDEAEREAARKSFADESVVKVMVGLTGQFPLKKYLIDMFLAVCVSAMRRTSPQPNVCQSGHNCGKRSRRNLHAS